MYKLFVDKPDIFEATVMIEGADSNSALCRLVVESKDVNLLFEGDLKGENCKIPIKKLKQYFKEGDSGTLKLEVIADDTYFTPWESEFTAKYSRKVTAEVSDYSEDSDKPKVIAEVFKKVNTYNKEEIVGSLSKEFKKRKITLENVDKRKKTINHVVRKLIKDGVIGSDMMSDPSLVDLVLESIIINEKN